MRVGAPSQFAAPAQCVAPCDVPTDEPAFQISFAEDLGVAVNQPQRALDSLKAAEQLVAATLLNFVPLQAVPSPMDELVQMPLAVVQMPADLTLQDLIEPTCDVDAEPTSCEEEPREAAADTFVMPEIELPKAVKHDAKGPVATLAVSEPAPLPDNPNPSHVHLVMDDGPERVVITVAVRGNEVNVGLRSNDEQLTAAIARNAATLDHAMHVRGLDLTGFSTDRESQHDREHGEEPDAERKEKR